MQGKEDSNVQGVLLVNLGTPDSPSVADVRSYLKEFLWDPRVVKMARPVWWLVLNLVILNTRPKRSAAAYAKVWTEEGSPLLVISRQQQQALQAKFDQQSDGTIKVVLAMRYGTPSITAGLDELRAAGVQDIRVLPLYPQYSDTTTAAVHDAVTAALQGGAWQPQLNYVDSYYDHPSYINALADSVRHYQSIHGSPDKLVMSFHGIPEDYVEAGDPYAGECEETARLLADALGLSSQQWCQTYQSRLGPKQWLQPYTIEQLVVLAGNGVRKVQVVCPGFSVDCLETLEEIALENRAAFLGAGGETYDYIPCLNDDSSHIDLFAELVMQNTKDRIS
jgi:ferrochelatase